MSAVVAIHSVAGAVTRGAVPRPRLVDPLCRSDAPPVVVLVAPAGYGKTMLLREWDGTDPRPFAWLTLDAHDNDPVRLLGAVTRETERARRAAGDGRVVLVLDDVHVLARPAAVEVLGAIAGGLPPELTLALASRADPPLPLARWRAEQVVREIRAGELAMEPREADTLLRRAGPELDRASAERVIGKAEGWPAALALAALSCRAEDPATPAAADFDGGERLVADYVREEILAGLPADRRAFLLRTSILDTLSGPVCDAVAGRSDSALLLGELARSNVPLIPLDRHGERYRYQGLFAETLRAELRLTASELEPQLHRAASAWYRHAGDVDRAIRHARGGRDTSRAGALVWRSALKGVTQGRSATIARWLDWFTDDEIAASPPLALAAASCHLVRGEGELAEHWCSVAEGARGRHPASIDAAIAALRAAAGHRGLLGMCEDADRAAALAPVDSTCRALCSFINGVAAHLLGFRDEAEHALHDGTRRAAVTLPALHALCLAQLGVLTLERDELDEAEVLIARARAQVDRHGLQDEPITALVFAASALVRARRARAAEARGDIDAGTRLAAALTDFAPWYEVETHILLARAALRLSDAGGARARLVDASRRIRYVPEAGVLAGWLGDTEAQLAEFAGCPTALEDTLTAAELRILGFLPTHLSFREIAERTYVSANTVKSQAHAVYRKLGVSSRSDAVAYARRLGLLDPAA